MGNSQESLCFIYLPPKLLLGLEEWIFSPSVGCLYRDDQCYKLMSRGGSLMASLLIIAAYYNLVIESEYEIFSLNHSWIIKME